ncbi:MAG: AMP-binding protein [Gammaproteobacteria bacterium]
MCADLVPLDRIVLEGNDSDAVSLHRGLSVERRHFRRDVAAAADQLRHQPHRQYALYTETAYPFAVSLFALWHAGKHVVLPGNNRPATAESLLRNGCRLSGDWPGDRDCFQDTGTGAASKLTPLDPLQTRLTLFTSGSEGDPKAIEKSLIHLQREVETLERQWGAMLGAASAAATVSHQHIYGLLFGLLWPLAAGRCFHSLLYPDPESMLKASSTAPTYWVASPAQLKRLDDLSPWSEMARLKAIFSSGGALPEAAARRIETHSGLRVVEIYGSSETGGIGWRTVPDSPYWTPFPNIELAADGNNGRCRLRSPYLPEPGSCLLDDRIELHPDGRFTLAGRLDRIVKVEEKRLSLDALERVLEQSDLVAQAHCLLLYGNRDRIAAVVAVSESGRAMLFRHGEGFVIRQLREHSMHAFEAVALPRKWLFFDALPLTAQGKLDRELVSALLRLDSAKYPQLLFCRRADHKIELELRVRPKLRYFDGHFPERPILPGVAQLAWAEHYGKLFFPIVEPFSTLEVVKFKKIIRPGATLTMSLEWKPSTGKLYFEIHSAAEAHSSGRMVYGAHP